MARGFLRADADKFGAIVLEEKCRGLLRGEETIQLRRDIIDKSSKSTTKKLTKTPLPDDIDVTLWEALRETRRTLAEEQGVPPYVIFHDKTLQAMAEDMPSTLDAFSRLPGVGERKRDKYGETFLKIING